MNARRLRNNDLLVCPVDGHTERVVVARAGTPGRTFVRTTRHDHNWPNGKAVEIIARGGDRSAT